MSRAAREPRERPARFGEKERLRKSPLMLSTSSSILFLPSGEVVAPPARRVRAPAVLSAPSKSVSPACSIERTTQHAFGQFGRKIVSHTLKFVLCGLELGFYFGPHLLERFPCLGFGRLRHLRGFALGLAALGFTPGDCVAPERGQPPFALLISGARLLDQLLGAIVQVLEPSLTLGEQV